MKNLRFDGKKILIIKLGSIGDVIHTLPVLEAIKKQHPTACVSWLVEPKSLNIIKNNPMLDEIILFKRNYSNVLNTIQTIRKKNFDYVIDLQGTYKSQMFCLFSGSPCRIGFNKTKEFFPLAYNIKIPLPTMDRHAVDRNLDLLENIGIQRPKTINFPIEFPKEKKWDFKNYCVISASAGKPANRWDADNFSELASKISKELQLDVVFIGSLADKDLNTNIIKKSKQQRIHDFSGLLSLKETCLLLKGSKFLICGDTGPMHMAVAVGCPVIALFGSSSPQRTGPYNGNNIVIQKTTPCAPCYKKTCKQMTCLKNITIDEVFSYAKNYK